MGLFDGIVNDRRRQELLRSGAPAQATVTGIKSLGRTSAQGTLTELTLQIDPTVGRPFTRTVREWLNPATESGLTLGATVSVRHDGKAVVLEATDGSGPASGGQATWVAPPGPLSGSWASAPGAQSSPVHTTYISTNLSALTDAQEVADLVKAALEQLPGAVANPLMAAQAEAPATIVDVADLSQTGQYTTSRVRLRVEPSGEPAFETTTTVTFISPERRAKHSPGRTVQVRYDPANHATVLIIPDTVR
jgi:uncharacterized protein DUF3592